MHKITDIKYLNNYQIKLKFDDSKEGYIDLAQYLWGEMFEPLKDLKYFKKLFIDKDTGTVTWPNGADIAPETLYDGVK